MKDDIKTISIDPDVLVARLHQVEENARGDVARVIELLLLENHMLVLEQSSGYRRGVQFDFSNFPRFLKMTDEANEISAKPGNRLNEPAPDE